MGSRGTSLPCAALASCRHLYAGRVASLPESLGTAPIASEKLPREVLAAHQRQRILDAAVDVFAKRGYQATTVETHIVPAAKISIGNFYQHFADKEECFLAAYEQIVAEAREEITVAVPDAPWPDQLVAVLSAAVAYIADNRLKARLVLVEAPAAGPKALAAYQQTLESAVPSLRRARELAPPGKALPESLETSTLGGLVWVLQQRLLTGKIELSRRFLGELVDLVAGPYIGEAEVKQLVRR
jgi:AcrR family transcriptional regulator